MSKPMSESEWKAQLKKFGVKAEYYGDNWYRRSRTPNTGIPFNDVHGVVIHHTGGNVHTDENYTHFLFVTGRSDLPAPLCHGEGRDDGTVVMGAGGRTNHAGRGSSKSLTAVIEDKVPLHSELDPQSNDNGIDGNRHFYGLEIDYGGSASGPTNAQREAAVNWTAAICDFHGWSGQSVIGHREWTYTKSDPARINMGNFRRAVNARIAEVNGEELPKDEPPITETIPPKDTSVYPFNILNLHNSKLTMPYGETNHPTEIFRPKLDTFIHDLFKVIQVGQRKCVQMITPVNGVHTENTKYCRNEFREMVNNGTKLAAWSNKNEKHIQRIEFAVTGLPTNKPHVCIAQIHNATDDLMEVRLEGKVLKVTHDSKVLAVLDDNYQLGQIRKLVIVAAPGGIWVSYNNKPGVKVLTGTFSGCYFKGGNYVQAFAGQEYQGKIVPKAARAIVDLYEYSTQTLAA